MRSRCLAEYPHGHVRRPHGGDPGPGGLEYRHHPGGHLLVEVARVVRGETLSMKTGIFVQLARIAGMRKSRIIWSISCPMYSAA